MKSVVCTMSGQQKEMMTGAYTETLDASLVVEQVAEAVRMLLH